VIKTPLLADLKPSGKYQWKTCMKLVRSCGNEIFIETGLLHGDCLFNGNRKNIS
jgi:hypothetical protein